ncbi:MAG: hypothetical protein JNK72_12750 [Myxococcales bacterium]|nr:hypothetical protein [Myxococcales bacterium]
MRRLHVALAAALLALSVGGVAAAQPSNRAAREEFERLIRTAAQEYNANNAQGAIAALQRAYALRPMARLLYNLGRAHELANQFSTAVQYYEQFLQSNPDAEAAAVAREALTVARRRAEEQASAEQARRGAEEAERQRAIEAERARAAEAERARAEAERQRAMLGVSRPRRITPPVAAAGIVAGVAGVTAGVLGALAITQHDNFTESREGNARADAYDNGRAFALGADIALGTTLVAGVAALVLYLVQPTRVEGPAPAVSGTP